MRAFGGQADDGRNLFPARPTMRYVALTWPDEMTQLAHALMRGIALSLGLDASY
jgi:isopenicillin N synthase-like dioxygenase